MFIKLQQAQHFKVIIYSQQMCIFSLNPRFRDEEGSCRGAVTCLPPEERADGLPGRRLRSRSAEAALRSPALPHCSRAKRDRRSTPYQSRLSLRAHTHINNCSTEDPLLMPANSDREHDFEGLGPHRQSAAGARPSPAFHGTSVPVGRGGEAGAEPRGGELKPQSMKQRGLHFF